MVEMWKTTSHVKVWKTTLKWSVENHLEVKCGKPPFMWRCGKLPMHSFPPTIPTHSSTYSWTSSFVTSHFLNQQPSRFVPRIWVKGDHYGRYTYMTLTLSNWTLTPHIHMTSPRRGNQLRPFVHTLIHSTTAGADPTTDVPSNDGTNRHECKKTTT